MIKTFTLEDAITQVFNVDDVPQFKTYKPVKEARAWLERNGIDFEYQRETVKDGIAIITYGAGQPLYVIVDGNHKDLRGAQVLGVLSPKYKSKSEQRRVEAIKADSADVEEPPVIENAPEQSEPEMTVTDETPTPKPRQNRKPRKSRRSK